MDVLPTTGLLVLFIVELIVVLFWVQPAWPLGLPLFRTARRLPANATQLPSATDIQSSEAADVGIGPPFRFRQFHDESVGFREGFQWRIFGFNYTPLMRGRVFINHYSGELMVEGYAYWWPIVFSALFLYSFSNAPAPDASFLVPLAVMVGMLIALWTIQAMRFRKIADRVIELMSAPVRTAA